MHNIVSVYLSSKLQRVKLQGTIVGTTGPEVGLTGLVHGLPGTSHWPAESEQSSTWPFGERQSLFWKLSHVPEDEETTR